MKKISVIIDGIKYDAVNKNEFAYGISICGNCDICSKVPNFPCNSLIGADRVFKKSDEMFEV